MTPYEAGRLKFGNVNLAYIADIFARREKSDRSTTHGFDDKEPRIRLRTFRSFDEPPQKRT